MNAAMYEFPESGKWQALYKAAIVEADSTKLPDRIAEAKKVIVERARDLFQAGGENFEEEQALDDAIRVLHALHGTLKSRMIALRLTCNEGKTGESAA
jgi:hypothetical protein